MAAETFLVAADGQVKNLDFGGIEGLLYFKAGSTLFFANTNATGTGGHHAWLRAQPQAAFVGIQP